jgi:hypothetical protein
MSQDAHARLSEAEMFAFLLGATIEREEWPTSAEDLVGQTWRRCEGGWELVRAEDSEGRA